LNALQRLGAYCNSDVPEHKITRVTATFSLTHLLFILLSIIAAIILLFRSFSLLPPDTAVAPATKGRRKGEVDMLLGIETHNKGRNINNLLPNSNMSLTDKNASMMNGLCETKLIDAGLQAALQEVLNLQSQDVIQLHARLVKNANANKTTDERIPFKQAFRIFFIKGQKLTAKALGRTVLSKRLGRIPGSTTDFGKCKQDTPDFTLIPQTIFSNRLQLRIPKRSVEEQTT
jgi:hypothetical protein